MNTTSDPVVTAYLERLRAAGTRLSPDELQDVWASVTEHLDAAGERGESPEAALRRLGTPEEIVAAYAGEGAPTASPGPTREPWQPRMRALDVWALVLLELGALLFGIGWIVGVGLLWASDRWKWWEKLLGTLVVPGGLSGFVLWAGLFAWGTAESGPVTCPVDGGECTGGTTTTSGGGFTGWAFLVLLATAVAVTVYLALAARPGRSSSRRGQTV